MFRQFRERFEEENYVPGLKVFNVIAFAFLLVSSFLIYGGYIGKISILESSTKYVNFFTPTNWTFGIMSIIILLQFVYVVYQALPHDVEKSPYIIRLNFFLPFAWIFEAASLYSLNYDIVWLSFVFISISLVFTAIAYFRLNTLPLQLAHVLAARIDGRDKACAAFYYLIFYAPTSLNLAMLCGGWLLNLLMMFRSLGYILPLSVPIICSVVIAIVGLVMLGTNRDTLFGLAVAWTLFGVGMKWRLFNLSIGITNLLCAVVLLLTTVITFGIAVRKTPNLLEKENIDTYRTRTSYTTGIHPTDTTRLVST